MVDLPMRRIDEEVSPRFVSNVRRISHTHKVPAPDRVARPSSDIHNDEIRLSTTRKYTPRADPPIIYGDATRKVIQTNSSPYLSSGQSLLQKSGTFTKESQKKTSNSETKHVIKDYPRTIMNSKTKNTSLLREGIRGSNFVRSKTISQPNEDIGKPSKYRTLGVTGEVSKDRSNSMAVGRITQKIVTPSQYFGTVDNEVKNRIVLGAKSAFRERAEDIVIEDWKSKLNSSVDLVPAHVVYQERISHRPIRTADGQKIISETRNLKPTKTGSKKY
jgi:hypothetical protein